jgi:hypothetical protein
MIFIVFGQTGPHQIESRFIVVHDQDFVQLRTPLKRHYTLVTECLEHRSNEWVLENPLIGAFDELKTVALPRRIRRLNAGRPDLANIAVLSRR